MTCSVMQSLKDKYYITIYRIARAGKATGSRLEVTRERTVTTNRTKRFCHVKTLKI